MTHDFKVGTKPQVPKGYTAIQLLDNTIKKAKIYYVPVGTKITYQGKTHDPSETTNNQFVLINDHKNNEGFKIIGLTLESMDTNGDGRIDSRDNDPRFAQHLSAALKKAGVKGDVRKGAASQTQLSNGQGGAVIYRNPADSSTSFYSVELWQDPYKK